MEVNHRTAAHIRPLPEMRTEAQRAGGLHRTEERERGKERGRERERERHVPTSGGRPLKKVMRIYFDGRESRACTRRKSEESRRESFARAAFVNDECVAARGGKLR